MLGNMLLNTLIGQEKRAANLFIFLLVTLIFISDFLTQFFSLGIFGLLLLFPYLIIFLLIPSAFVLIKKNNPRRIKYVFFLTFLFVSLVTEITIYWGSTDYKGGTVAEIFFILFSPIFISKRYFMTVSIGIICKYVLVGLLLQTSVVLLMMGLILVFALVAFIILNRFLGYIDVLNDSYNKQFETTLSSGMAIMNHTIKNEITKIQYLNSRIKELITNRNIEDVDSMMESIHQATNHMLSMSNRLQAKTGEITLEEGTHNLISIVNSAVSMIEPNLQKNQVRCIQELNYDADIMCDQLQLQEALMNIMMNAVESMELDGGTLTIRLFKVMKDIVIEIEDTGCGIPSDIRSRVLELFFTTKTLLNNHGLGLNYSYNVMQKHGGSLEILSEVNVGTKVSLRFPHHRIVQMRKYDKGKDKPTRMEGLHA
ncbi:MAG: HAMP domain-containing sensor histidine kinase [Paenibacillaceae bacterium]